MVRSGQFAGNFKDLEVLADGWAIGKKGGCQWGLRSKLRGAPKKISESVLGKSAATASKT
jgi:hypothetical protein